MRHRLILPLAALLLLGSAPLPAMQAAPAPSPPGAGAPRRLDPRFTGVWALVDNLNNLFNVRLTADGRAVSTSGVDGSPLAGSQNLRAEQLFERGRWQPWGNGVRVDYDDGWSDVIVTGPSGPVQWSWAPGKDRTQPPQNSGKAVKLGGPIAMATGLYRIHPAQPQLPATPVSLLSNGLAFNTLDRSAGGVWRLEKGEVLILWSSGWRTRFAPAAQGPLRVRIWQPGADPAGPPTAVRTGARIE